MEGWTDKPDRHVMLSPKIGVSLVVYSEAERLSKDAFYSCCLFLSLSLSGCLASLLPLEVSVCGPEWECGGGIGDR